jgi:dTMP kinase
MPTRGKFIVVDGGEGAGTTSMSKWVVDYSRQFGHDLLWTREPGGAPYAEKIRELILSADGKHADAETMFGLFWAARRDHLVSTVVPALEKGTHVISDRFDSSTWAYQIVGQKQPQLRDLFHAMRTHYVINAGVRPDQYVILDVLPEIGLARAKGRGGTMTHFDERSLDFHRSVNNAFVAWARSYPTESVILDATMPEKDVRLGLLNVVGSLCWGPRDTWPKQEIPAA